LKAVYDVNPAERELGEREKRCLLFLYMGDALRLFFKKMGFEVTREKLEEKLSALMENEDELLYLMGDEVFVTISEAAEVFNIKRSRIMSATLRNHLKPIDRVAAFYNYQGRGVRKLKHVALHEVALWLKTRSDLLETRDGEKEDSES